MEQQKILVYTLKECARWRKVDLLTDEVFSYEVRVEETFEIECKYPSKINCFSLILITQGTLVVSVDSQDIKLSAKDILFLYPSNIIEFIEFSDCTFNSVLISVDFFSSLNLQINSQDALDILSNNYSKTVSLSDESYHRVLNNFTGIGIFNSRNSSNVFFEEMIKNSLQLIMYELANFVHVQHISNYKSFRKEDVTVKFIGLLGQYFREKKNVQFYADKLSITRAHLTRTVSEVYQKTPKQIIEDKLIAEIKVLLLRNTQSISQIMQQFHFEDQSAFTKFFKKKTGYTPSSYKRDNLSK
ncbi:helix-turn-helix domain-containing protein [Chryseobacterium lathyri]|uniref:AraC-like DNA-binding protein n=1 Tax=Chryseobacterium lathyri TaxID=395933 RepID=A0ABT9SQY0_9FLAO|nr:helix-turn-helix domain-containing protein [Chryseobacterium lathyri]MDP9961844.1 AraC-like DNA-binding protein [Chryseobacterium lathyri]MDQ0064219.1 AraC-like DNA-binding protein [Chryseobacterium lathyri]